VGPALRRGHAPAPVEGREGVATGCVGHTASGSVRMSRLSDDDARRLTGSAQLRPGDAPARAGIGARYASS
jgi:hypothetical protein